MSSLTNPLFSWSWMLVRINNNCCLPHCKNTDFDQVCEYVAKVFVCCCLQEWTCTITSVTLSTFTYPSTSTTPSAQTSTSSCGTRWVRIHHLVSAICGVPLMMERPKLQNEPACFFFPSSLYSNQLKSTCCIFWCVAEFLWLWRPVQWNMEGLLRERHHSPEDLRLQKSRFTYCCHASPVQYVPVFDFVDWLTHSCRPQVCFRDTFFSLLPRMRYGLFYNTPLVSYLGPRVNLHVRLLTPDPSRVFANCQIPVQYSL